VADVKISALNSLTNVDSSDVLVINDVSAGETKKTAVTNLLNLTTRNIYDSGDVAVARGDLVVNNEIISGGDITTQTGTISFGALKDATKGIFVSQFVKSTDDLSANLTDSAIPTFAAVAGYINSGEIRYGDLIPLADSAYDLGDSVTKWKDLYLSGSTIYLGGKIIKEVSSELQVLNATAIRAQSFIGDGSGLTGVIAAGGGDGGGLSADSVRAILVEEGAVGTDARSLKLIPINGQVIRYDSTGTDENDTLSFRAVTEGYATTPTFEFYIKNAADDESLYSLAQGPSATNTFTLPDEDEPGARGVKMIKCVGLEAGDSVAQDVVSVYGVANGTSVFGYLTNASHVEPADSAGLLITPLDDAGGTFKVLLGTTEIQDDANVTFQTIDNAGINVSINSSGVYSLSGFASQNTDKGYAIFRATVASALIPNSSSPQIIDQVYSISKSRQGIGAAGLLGGDDARFVKLIPDAGQVIRYDKSGNETDSLTFSTAIEGFVGAVTYKFDVKTPGGSYVEKQARGVLDTFTLDDADEPAAEEVRVVRVTAYEDAVEKATDYVTVYGLKNGTTIQGFLTNESHTEPADQSGNLLGSLDDAGGLFKVFLGTTDISTGNSIVYSVDSESTGINSTIDAATGSYAITSFASNVNKGSVRFQASVPGSLFGDTGNLLFDRVYSITKSKDGVIGADAYSVFLSNENVSIVCDSAGTPKAGAYGITDAKITAFKGGTRLQAVSGVPSTGEFRVVDPPTATNITAGTLGISGFDATIGDASSITAATASVLYEVQLEGTSLTLDKEQTFTKINDGIGGGAAGAASALKSATGYVYYLLTSATQPDTPSATDYDFVNGDFNNTLTANWGTIPIQIDSANTNQWASYFSASEVTAGGTVNVTFSAPFQSIIFDGLVTFKNLNDALGDPGNGNITTIDGGLITTGTINTARLNVSDIISVGNIAISDDLITFITADSVNDNVTSISGNAITTGTINTARLNVSDIITTGNIAISDDLITFITADSVNDNVTAISGNAITTGTISAARIDAATLISTNNIITTGNIPAATDLNVDQQVASQGRTLMTGTTITIQSWDGSQFRTRVKLGDLS